MGSPDQRLIGQKSLGGQGESPVHDGKEEIVLNMKYKPVVLLQFSHRCFLKGSPGFSDIPLMCCLPNRSPIRLYVSERSDVRS